MQQFFYTDLQCLTYSEYLYQSNQQRSLCDYAPDYYLLGHKYLHFNYILTSQQQ